MSDLDSPLPMYPADQRRVDASRSRSRVIVSRRWAMIAAFALSPACDWNTATVPSSSDEPESYAMQVSVGAAGQLADDATDSSSSNSASSGLSTTAGTLGSATTATQNANGSGGGSNGGGSDSSGAGNAVGLTDSATDTADDSSANQGAGTTPAADEDSSMAEEEPVVEEAMTVEPAVDEMMPEEPVMEEAPADAAATMTFTVTTQATGGKYAPKNIGAIWITDGSGQYIRTLELWAQRRERYLTAYRSANAARDRTDAITSATISNHREHQVSWDFTDLQGNLVPDGEYKVFVEMTDKDATGPSASFSFTKEAMSMDLSEAFISNAHLEVAPQ